jgi:hypothetical protein
LALLSLPKIKCFDPSYSAALHRASNEAIVLTLLEAGRNGGAKSEGLCSKQGVTEARKGSKHLIFGERCFAKSQKH